MSHPPNVEKLQTLQLTTEDIESQTGFITNGWWVGSLFGGVYRRSAWHQPQYWLHIFSVEMIMLAFIGMLSVPIGLITLRDSAPQQTHRFLQVTATATTLMFSGWHFYLWHRTRTLRILMHMLDDIDQYNQLVETVMVLKGLTQAHPSTQVEDLTSILSALQVSRTHLVTALTLETQIRRHRRLLHRHQTLGQDLDQALIALQALEVQEKAQEYQQVIHQAIQISMRVQTTMRQLSTRH